MAIYRLEAKVFSREKRGRSVVAAAAYRAGTKLRDEHNGVTFDYARRSKGVVSSAILAPEGAPAWVRDSNRLWNAVEAGEKRKDAQLAREFILAVPKELDAKAQFHAAVEWTQKELVASGMVAEVSLHHDKAGRNPHVHILCTMRKLDGDGFSPKKSREWNNVALLLQLREEWAKSVNAALEKAGHDMRVDHRSLEDQGIDRLPQPKIGVAATAMKNKGIVEDPDRFKEVRWVQTLNEARPLMKAIRKRGEVKQIGVGGTWWERSIIFMSRARERVSDAIKNTWQRLIEKGRDNGPDR